MVIYKEFTFFFESEMDLKDQIGELEARVITFALERSGGNKTHAADFVGLQRKTFVNKVTKYDIRDIDFSNPDPKTTDQSS